MLLVPLVVLVLGALATAGGKGLRLRKSTRALIVLGAACIAMAALYGRGPLTLSISRWTRPNAPDWELSLYLDRLSSLFTIALLYLGMVSILVGSQSDSDHSLATVPLVLGATLLALWAGSLPSLYLSWAILDLALLVYIAGGRGQEGAWREAAKLIIWGQAAGLGIILVWAKSGGKEATGLTGPLSPLVVPGLALAALLRAGIWPAHLWLPERADFSKAEALLAFGIPAAAGLCLLGRLYPLPKGPVMLFAALTLLVTALMSLRAPLRSKGAYYLLVNQAAYVPLILSLPMPGGQGLAILQGVNALLSGALILVSLEGGRWLPLVSWGYLVGLPFTPGFAARWLFYESTLSAGRGWYVMLGVLATLGIGAMLLGLLEKGGERHLNMYGAGALLVAPLVLLGVHPPILGSLLGASATTDLPSFLDMLRYSAYRWTVLAALLLPVLGSLAVYRLRRLGLLRPSNFGEMASQIWELRWLYPPVRWAEAQFGSTVQAIEGSLRGKYSLIWTLLGGLTIVLLYMAG